MNLRFLTHPELINRLETIQAVERLSRSDADTVRFLIQQRSFTRSQKEIISKLSTKYAHEQHDRYTIKVSSHTSQNPS